MKYEDIKGWLKSASPATYNFAEDTQGEDWKKHDYGMITDPYERYFIYRASLYKKLHEQCLLDESICQKVLDFCNRAAEYKTKDPDTYSKLLQSVYRTLWPDFFEQSYMKEGTEWVASDNMTSGQNAVQAVMKHFLTDEKIGSIYTEKKAYASTNSSIALAANLGEYFYQKLHTTCPNLGKFLDLYHTIGNYCPVPVGFNGARSGYFADHDYWDLTLMKIREWYDNKDDDFNDKLLEQQLLHGKGNWKNCKLWLSSFERGRKRKGKDGWHNFIDTLWMQDYVDESYHVIPFWEGHSWRNPAMPKDPETINKALEEICTRIAKRSERMILALCAMKI